MIAHVVKAEVGPLSGRHKRIDFDAAVGLRTNACYTRDDQVVEGGMVVVAAAFTVAHEPCAVGLVKIFADIRSAAVVLALHIQFHLLEECLLAHQRLGVVVDVVDHGSERLARCKRPDGTVPFAGACAVRAELWMAAFGGGQSVGGRESFLVLHLFPSLVIFSCLGHVEIPGDETYGLANGCQGVATHGFKELVIAVPQFVLDETLLLLCLLAVAVGLVLVAGKCIDGSKRLCIAKHITVDGGAGVFFLSATADAFFHAVLHIALPVEAVVQSVGALPAGILLFQRRFQGQ